VSATVEELERSLPRGIGSAPARARTHYARILALLRERGPAGVLGSELYSAPHLYGRSPRNRISELRRDFGLALRSDSREWLAHFAQVAAQASRTVAALCSPPCP
jgi:hypothetical protein